MTLLGEIERSATAAEDLGVLRFITAGSVDDGKSTLIGRLLHDTRAIFEDQLAAVARASTADAAVILIDARKGVLTQTRRHATIAHLLGVGHVIVAVNKMDLVNYDEAVFERIRKDFLTFVSALAIADLRFIPISALRGDLVVERGESMRWYRGPTLLAALEEIDVADEADALPFRFPVQLVVRPGAGTDFRGYSGRIESGVLVRGAEVLALPSGRRTVVKDIVCLDSSLPVAIAGDSVTLTLADDIDISRGDMLADPARPPRTAKTVEARICWLSSQPLAAPALPAARFVLKHTTRSVKAKLVSLNSRVDVDTLERQAKPAALAMNDVAHVTLALAQPLFVDSYQLNRATGSFILIDEVFNQTVAAGMLDG